jgi:hypothetical protein
MAKWWKSWREQLEVTREIVAGFADAANHLR